MPHSGRWDQASGCSTRFTSGRFLSHRDCQSCLAHTADSREGEQRVLLQRRYHLSDRALPPDQDDFVADGRVRYRREIHARVLERWPRQDQYAASAHEHASGVEPVEAVAGADRDDAEPHAGSDRKRRLGRETLTRSESLHFHES